MLQHLIIQNYALIDSLEIDLSNGLTIITGETGAGKSILLGALSLLIGSRADTSTLRDNSKKCIVEAQFAIEKYALMPFFEKHQLDYSKLTTLRREINPAGISRAFINDTPVNLAQLKEIGMSLIDIHSQHQSIALNEAAFQISLLDVFAQNKSKLTAYQADFASYKKAKQSLVAMEEQDAQAKKDLDYFQFQFAELEEANLKIGELLSMEQELETLTYSETIKKAIGSSINLLNQADTNVLGLVSELKSLLGSISKYNTSVSEIGTRVSSVYIELKDILAELEGLEQDIVFNPLRLENIETRLNSIYRLQQKHRVKTTEELIEVRESLSEKIQAISGLDDQISKVKAEIAKFEKQLTIKAEALSKGRQTASIQLEKQVRTQLTELGMPHAKLSLKITDAVDFNNFGRDKVQFLFSANKGSDEKELNKVASGGELSRLLLSLKSILAQSTALPTIIFDEIDTGVSGEVAAKVGNILEKMALEMQVISITHLPQIASKGKEHLYVYKVEQGEKTLTHIRKLNKQERVQEIAQMLSNKSPSAAAISNAKDLLKH
jgi:DNA repair protein RecN (Recombination protein N)